MNRYVHYLTSLLAAGALLFSCAKQEKGGERQQIHFSASVGSFQVKATATAFEEGDVVSLWADEPVGAENVKLTWDGNTLVPETSVCWGAGQPDTQPVNFIAYSPYVTSVLEDNPAEFIFSVQTDQRTEAAIKASDLMSAETTVAPKDGNTVPLNFLHRMSMVVLSIDNRLGKEITDVMVDGLHLDYRCWRYDGAEYWGALYEDRYSDNIGAIRPAQVSLPDGSPAWLFITIPQRVHPQFQVVTVDGNVYTYNVSDEVFFASGRRYAATLVADERAGEVNFQATVMDWLEGNDLYFGRNGDDPGVQKHVWSVIFEGNKYPMEEVEDGIFYLRYAAFRSGWGFNLMRNNGDMRLGSAVADYFPYLGEEDEVTIPLAGNGYINVSTDNQIVDLWLNESERTLRVKPVPHQWESMGTGTFIDGILAYRFGYAQEEIPVTVMKDEAPGYEGWYKMVEPYNYGPYVQDSGTFSDYIPSDIIIRTKEDGSCWIPSYTSTGLVSPSRGLLNIDMRVPENGYSNNWQYGYFDEEQGFFRVNNSMDMRWDNGSSFTSNYNGIFSLTLPGYERRVHFVTFESCYLDHTHVEDGTTYADFNIWTGMDATMLKYGLFAGTLSQEEADGLWEDVRDNGTSVTDFNPGYWTYLSIPIQQTGSYTIILYTQDNDTGIYYWSWRFFAFPIVVEGDPAPEAQLSVKAQPDPYFPDVAIIAHVNFADPSELRTAIMKQADFESAGLTEDDIYDYVYSNGNWINVSTIGAEGVDIPFSNLQPGTVYRLMVAGRTLFEISAWDSILFTTPDSPEFEYVGKGEFRDNIFFEFSTEADILRATTIDSRYRLLDPFKSYWGDQEPDDYYSGSSADYIDFALDGEHIYYQPIETGYKEPGYGPLFYCMYYFDDWDRPTEGNIRLQEGVYSLAPYGLLYGTESYYDLRRTDAVQIIMPGYSFDPAASQAAAPMRVPMKPTPSAFPAPVQREARPLTRHMLYTGKAKVASQNIPSVELEK